MKKLVAIACLWMMFSATTLPQSRPEPHASRIDNESTEWIANALRSMQTIKVGMTRSDLMKIFTTEGGLEFKDETTSRRTYVYRKCPHIKVDVTLAIANPAVDLPSDAITEISRPYLD